MSDVNVPTPEVKSKRKRAKSKGAKSKVDKKSTKATPTSGVQPKPLKKDEIGQSPLDWKDRPKSIDRKLVEAADGAFEMVQWLKEYAPRGVSLNDKAAAKVMEKPGASIGFEPEWLVWMMNSTMIKLMHEAADKNNYDAIKDHCGRVLKSYLKEERKTRTNYAKHVAASVAGASQRTTGIELWKIFIKHLNLL